MVDWNSIFCEHSRSLFGIAWRILGQSQDAEDVVQEVFREAYRFSNSSDDVCWPALLRRITTCRALDALRRRQSMVPLDETHPSAARDTPEAVAVAQELETRLRIVLSELAPRQAEVFCLRYFEDLSYREIAATLEISPTAASTALSQARSRLEKRLL